jgi:hypothetical protein
VSPTNGAVSACCSTLQVRTTLLHVHGPLPKFCLLYIMLGYSSSVYHRQMALWLNREVDCSGHPSTQLRCWQLRCVLGEEETALYAGTITV